MKLVKFLLFGMSSFLSLHWNTFFSFFAPEVNTELKTMRIHRGQDLESVRYIPLIKLYRVTHRAVWTFAIARTDAFRKSILDLLTLW